MTPSLFAAFRRRRGIVPLSIDEMRRAGWNDGDIQSATRRGYIRSSVVHHTKIYDLINNPTQKAEPKPMPRVAKRKPAPKQIITDEAKYAKALRDLCRAEGHIAGLPGPYHKGARG